MKKWFKAYRGITKVYRSIPLRSGTNLFRSASHFRSKFKQRRSAANVARALSERNLAVLNAEKLLRLLPLPGDQTCHVLGSGWSLPDSLGSIGDRDFVIGINFSAIAYAKNNVYFVEFGGPGVDEIARAQIRLVDEVVRSHTDLVLFKNLWQEKNDFDYIVNNWGNRAYYVKDYLIPCTSPTHLEDALTDALRWDPVYLKQYRSSVMTAIILAFHRGYRKIVLHGVDFGGSYFFDLDDFTGLRHYRPPEKANPIAYEKATSSSVHETSANLVGVQSALPIFRALLQERGVELFCGSNRSPSSRILPVYMA